MKPEIALEKLIEGNNRFVSGVRSVEPLLSHQKMAELADKGQKPFAIILTCSDSRSPAEMIFDQGIGELFVVRVAGNVVAPSLLASIEFAASNFGSSLIMVMGHTKCGAIKASYDHVKNGGRKLPSQNLEDLVNKIKPVIEKASFEGVSKSEENLIDLYAQDNVRQSMQHIYEQSPIIRDLVTQDKIRIVGSVLDIKTGRVSIVPKEVKKSGEEYNPIWALA
jgi:carbonic anhydrase